MRTIAILILLIGCNLTKSEPNVAVATVLFLEPKATCEATFQGDLVEADKSTDFVSLARCEMPKGNKGLCRFHARATERDPAFTCVPFGGAGPAAAQAQAAPAPTPAPAPQPTPAPADAAAAKPAAKP